jgi:hypothetical protein
MSAGPLKGHGVAYPLEGEAMTVYVVAPEDHAWRLFQGDAMANVRDAAEAMTKRTDGAVVVMLSSGRSYTVRSVSNSGDVVLRRFAKCEDEAKSKADGGVVVEVGDEMTPRLADPPPVRQPWEFVEDFDAWIRKAVAGKNISAAYTGGKHHAPVRLSKCEEQALLSVWGWPLGRITTLSCHGDKWDHHVATDRLRKKLLLTSYDCAQHTMVPTPAGLERLRILHQETTSAAAQTTSNT